MDGHGVAASTDWTACVTTTGIPILIPTVTIEHFSALRLDLLELEVRMPGAATSADWLTITEAARLHTEDVDGLTEDAARKRIIRAVEAGKVRSRGTASRRKIDPDSFGAWRISARDKNLDQLDGR